MTSAGDIIAGRYRIEAPIGEGGMGAVFRATHLELGRTVAIKLVRSDDPSEQSLERFLREAKSAASVDHRNVVDVLDFGREANGARPYLVMECLAGESLESRLRRPPPPTLDEIVQWIAGALSGLAAIHDAGIVHRDLKPANLFLAEDADGIVPKVLDFGIARPTQEASALTHTMQTLGTPHYMSPEQVRSAKTVDARSDLYAVGVILYLAVTGKLPFDGPSATAVIAAIVTDDPVPVNELRPEVPRGLVRVIHKAMARQPSERWESARAMRQALLDAQQGIDASLAAERPSFTQAPTILAAPPSGMSRDGTAPRSRTGRRGFFAMLGVLSTLLMAGLAGSLALTNSELAAPTSAAPMAMSETRAAASVAPPMVSPPMPARPLEEAGPASSAALVGASPPESVEQVALRFRALGAADRANVRIGSDGSRYWLLAPPALLPSPTAVLPAETERFEALLLKTNVRANVRRAPEESAALRATIPEATLVVALRPESVSAEENDGDARWTRVVVADGLVGWIASSLLDPHADCVPNATTVGDPQTWIARTRISVGGVREEALLFFDPRDGGTIRIEAVDPICRTTPVARFSLPSGQISDLFLTRTARDGDTLIVVGRWPTRGSIPEDGMMSWSVHPIGDPERVVLSLDLRSGQNLPDALRTGIGGPYEEGAAYYPIRIRERRMLTQYVWDGERLVPAPSETHRIPARPGRED